MRALDSAPPRDLTDLSFGTFGVHKVSGRQPKKRAISEHLVGVSVETPNPSRERMQTSRRRGRPTNRL